MMTREYGKGYDEGYADGLKDAPQRTWIELNLDDLPEDHVGDKAFLQGAKWAEAMLREKNT